jgi:dehydrogenase/reductase SDR family protein 12
MLRSLLSFLFYARFYRRFSAAGLRERSRAWKPYDEGLGSQRWLVTGASGGIGAAVARLAHARGAEVLAVARSAAKLGDLQRERGGDARLKPLAVDLASIRAIRELVRGLAERGEKIDVLLNNVGVLLNDHSLTAEGFETSFATNLLGHYVLTEGLRAAGLFNPGAVVINMSSGGMYGTPLKLVEMDVRDPAAFDGMAAYALHKRAQVELTRAWNARWGGEPTVHVMHPGWADTAGVQSSLPWFRAMLASRLRTAEQAADTALWLGSTRPAVATDGGIWLDRALDPEHEFDYTRRSPVTGDQLIDYLARAAEGVR